MPRDRHQASPLVPRHPCLEGPESRGWRGPRRRTHERMARRDQTRARGPRVGAAPGGVLPEGCTPTQDPSPSAVDHFRAVCGKPRRAKHLPLEEPTHLGRGPRRDGADPCGAQRGLACGRHPAAVADEDQRGAPQPGPECVDVRRHGDRIGRVALVHRHGHGRTRRRGQPPTPAVRLARLPVPAIPQGRPGLVFALQVGGGHVIHDHRRSAAPRPYGPPRARVLQILLRLG
jgi:hypothetical protein